MSSTRVRMTPIISAIWDEVVARDLKHCTLVRVSRVQVGEPPPSNVIMSDKRLENATGEG